MVSVGTKVPWSRFLFKWLVNKLNILLKIEPDNQLLFDLTKRTYLIYLTSDSIKRRALTLNYHARNSRVVVCLLNNSFYFAMKNTVHATGKRSKNEYEVFYCPE